MKTEDALKALATFILEDLRCECGCTYEQSINESCACGFTRIADIFEDELGIRFKEYPDAVNEFYKE
jgi:hypothetical protein